jgi:glyoxylase-like metal-dependent hydrolase (beta-lactamase superfamily II)
MEYTVEQVIVGPLETNCWLYPLEEESPAPGPGRPCVVIDPGSDPGRIMARMEGLHWYPRYVLLTHGHFDHIAALSALADRYGAGLEIALHRDDADCLGPAASRNSASGAALANRLFGFDDDLPSPSRLFSGGDTLGPFTVLHLPGHSPGSAAFYDAAAGVLFSGDTLFRDGVGRTDFPGGDGGKLAASLRRLLALDGAVRVYPGHGPATTVAAERGP